jgi:tellurite resistance protein
VPAALRFLPAGLFGSVMGLAGLGLAWRAAEAILPVPALIAELWICLALLALAVLLPAYACKAWRHFAAVREELTNPALLGFSATLPVGITLAAAGVAPYSTALADLLWWTGALLLLAMQAWALVLLLSGRFRLAHVNGGLLIVLVGGIVTPFAGLPLGHAALSTAMFCVSAAAAPFVMGAILYRMAAGPALPEALRPSWFILLVPPSLIYVNGDTLWPGQGMPLELLHHLALLLAAALLYAARGCRRWPFGAPWWAFTFPLDALAGAALRHAGTHAGGPWTVLAGMLLLLATVAVTIVLVRTLMALVRGALLAAPAK